MGRVVTIVAFQIAASLLGSQPLGAQHHSPYAGQETREIKALSDQEVDGYLSGAGQGFALAAELNGYPGPRHVLELESQLGLSVEQAESTRALFEEMRRGAISLGQELVEVERQLDRDLASGAIDQEKLRSWVVKAAELRGRIRYLHLSAHLEMRRFLRPEQIALYQRLRGYSH